MNKYFKTETLEYKLNSAKENISPEFSMTEIENVFEENKKWHIYCEYSKRNIDENTL